MNQEIKSLALKQYFKYFAGWFVVAGLCLVITIGGFVVKSIDIGGERRNDKAPEQRVYDEANVLTDEEEEELEEYIAEKEEFGELDIVIVNISMDMGDESKWDSVMMNYADDFWDNGEFGWNTSIEGDGVCLVRNWYEDDNGSQKMSWLSTSGKMEDTVGYYEEDVIFDAMYRYIDSDPYKAYCAAVDEIADYGKYGYEEQGGDFSFFCIAVIVPIIVAGIYAATNLSQAKAKDTTVAGTYVENGQLKIRSKSDQFLRKSVSSYRVSSSSSSGGGSSHRGGGSAGSHRSSSGRSHGGGGRRG